MNDKYIIENGVIVECQDLMEWAKWMENGNRIIGRDTLQINNEEVRVSTVFLGLDHSFGHGAPVLFETMIFGGINDQWQDRYHTTDEAVAGHKAAVELAKSNVKSE